MIDFNEDYPCTCKPNEGPMDFMRKHTEELLRNRFEHLEKYTAAFLAQVGSAEASKYMLVESTNGVETRWYFKLRTDV